jgi:hypothetical protein
VWSKAGRSVEGLRAVGDILTTISANCVINLHATLLFACLFLWVIICAVITVFFLWVFLVYVYCHFSVNLCITDVFVCLRFIYNASARVMCVYTLIACSSKKNYVA